MSGSKSGNAAGEHEAQLLLPVVQAFMTTALGLVHAQRAILLRLQKGSIIVEARAHAVVPLLDREGLTGMLYLERQLAATTLSAEQMRFLELLAGQAAVSLETARLHATGMHEVHERRQVEQALRESRAMLLLGERINESGSWNWDVAQGDVNCSAEFCRMYEFAPYVSSIRRDALMQHIHRCDREHVIRTVDEAVARQRVFRFEHRISARNLRGRQWRWRRRGRV